jgi:hypothetical protein
MVALFLFLKGMTGALAPFSYLVKLYFKKISRLLWIPKNLYFLWFEVLLSY